MKILAVAFAYNEMPYIQDYVNYYHSQGIELFILDNHSTDGMTEFLNANNISTRIMPTGGAFHLKKLQGGLVAAIRDIKPDWVIYTGIDIYYSFRFSIRKTIERADAKGYNMIGVQHFNMYNTGEKFGTPLHERYFYARKGNILYMIAKYREPFGFEADSIQVKGRKVLHEKGVLINYGNCKPKSERIVTFLRRQKAWDRGLDPNYGVHYKEGMKKGWVWNKDSLIDIRETEYYKYIKKIRV